MERQSLYVKERPVNNSILFKVVIHYHTSYHFLEEGYLTTKKHIPSPFRPSQVYIVLKEHTQYHLTFINTITEATQAIKVTLLNLMQLKSCYSLTSLKCSTYYTIECCTVHYSSCVANYSAYTQEASIYANQSRILLPEKR